MSEMDFDVLKGLAFGRYRFWVRAGERGLGLREFAEATLRGGFGAVFREHQCLAAKIGEGVCESSCRFPDACPVPVVFAPAQGNGASSPEEDREEREGAVSTTAQLETDRRQNRLPRAVAPYILYVPGRAGLQLRPGGLFSFELTLVGQAMGYLEYFVKAFDVLFARGVGAGHETGTLEGVEAVGGVGNWLVYRKGGGLHPYHVPITAQHLMTGASLAGLDRPPNRLTLVFETPLRAKWRGALVSRPEFHIVLRAAVRRISRLMEQHCGVRLDIPYTELFERATEVRLFESHVGWKEYWRFSTRQGQNMQLGGMEGSATYEGDLAPYVPFLMAGQYLHAGKQAVFGFGKYKLIWG